MNNHHKTDIRVGAHKIFENRYDPNQTAQISRDKTRVMCRPIIVLDAKSRLSTTPDRTKTGFRIANIYAKLNEPPHL